MKRLTFPAMFFGAVLLSGCGGQVEEDVGEDSSLQGPAAAEEDDLADMRPGRKVEDLEFPVVMEPEASRGEARTILFLTDDGEHGWMQHENTAGAMLLGRRLAKGLPGCRVVVLRDEFPTAEQLAEAATVVLFNSGTGKHVLNDPAQREALEKAMAAGVGLVGIHWALEAGDEAGAAFLEENLGGFFEVNYSVNPMWKAEIEEVAKHAATQGVSPYTIYDEFYFNIRFPDTPGTRIDLAKAVPPKRVVLLPKDGPRSNNPTVRASAGKPHTLAWAYLQADGGRGFGFTGGHFHWDWKHDDQRRLLLNGIAWTAGFEIPEDGVPDERPTDSELFDYQDSPPMKGWKPMPGQPGRDEVEPAGA